MQSVRVLIVGAGAAGIAAASRLLQNGFTDIVVLEAEGRIGGRICTDNLGDGIVEMGAQWVHGEEGNVVFNIASPLNLLTKSITSLFDSTTIYVDSAGRMFKIHEMAHIFDIIRKIDEDSKSYFKTNSGSVGDYFTSEFKKRLKENHISPEEWPIANSILDWYEKLENSIDASDSWFETSGHGLTQYWDCTGNLLWSWKSGGFKTILDILMKKNANEDKDPPVCDKILFNKEVNKVTWDCLEGEKSGKVEVKCADGTFYVGDHLIFTASLGVLKERAHSLFVPSLPEEKLTSIKGLSIGTVDKIFLKFPHRWWPADVLGFNILCSEDDKKEYMKTKMEARDKSWLKGIFGFWALDNQPLVLYTWAVGPEGKKMESLSETEVVEDLMELLHRYLGRQYNIPNPDEIKRSTWASNPHFRGSYSFRSMESDQLGASASQLAQPVFNSSGKDVLLFAGEASHDHYYSTVHGAIETGWREADRLTKRYRDSTCCKVVIVGAGISGLAAAKTLLDGGINEIKILEAQDQPGGRILSLMFENDWLEAGAQWIHGQNSEVWRVANQHNLLSDVISSEGDGLYLREDGTIIDPRIVHEVFSVVSEILEECEQLIHRNNLEDDVPKSIGHYLKQRFIEYLKNCHNDSEDVKNMKYELYDWHVRFQVIDNSCTTLSKLSAIAWGKYSFCGGKDYVNFKEGYSSLIKCLVDGLPHGVLNLNSPVRRILWMDVMDSSCVNQMYNRVEHKYSVESRVCLDEESNLENAIKCNEDKNSDSLRGANVHNGSNVPVKIICEDGTVVLAEHVVITCSLGYLKENYKTMFSPELPDKISKAIEDLGFATINKIYLIYKEPWWSQETKGFQLIWLKNTEEFNYSEASSWTRDLTGFDVVTSQKAMLLGWVGGKGAELLENLSESEIGEHCTALLWKFTQQTDIPKPYKVVRTAWHGNPFVRGAYSNISTACDVSKVGPSTLAEPVFAKMRNFSMSSLMSSDKYPVLLFAGEATHDKFYSTTHGAFETGQKQADTILSFHQELSKAQRES